MSLTKVSGAILKDPLNLGEVSIGGTLTYQDVTNVDSVGIITARSGINVSAGEIVVGSNIKIGNAGIITASGLDISGDIDVDGHTNLDNVSIAGVSTFASNLIVNGGISNAQYLNLSALAPSIDFNDTNHNSDFMLQNANGLFKLYDSTNGVDRWTVNSDGTFDVNGNLDANAGLDVTGNITGTGDLTLTDTTADSAAGPELKLFRNSASPADADYLGQIKFAGESDTGVERNYAKITGKILDASNGTEDGIIEFAHIKGGSQNISARFRSDSLQLLNGTALTVAGSTTVTGNIIPSSDSATDIGTNSVRFANIYADTLYGDGSNLTGISVGVPGISTTGTSVFNNVTVSGISTINSLIVENYDGSGNSGIMTVPWKLGQSYSGGGAGGGTSNQVWGQFAGQNLNLSAAVQNVIIGREAAKGFDRGDSNVFIGSQAGPYDSGNNYENCDNNTVVSGYSMYFAGGNAKGNSVFGYHAS
ncbi:MAG: hypothetical protein VXY93_10210, partial [Pseudomonadota bacterium]|nr:hypothetical protein [Pseudomonadota bacterium]